MKFCQSNSYFYYLIESGYFVNFNGNDSTINQYSCRKLVWEKNNFINFLWWTFPIYNNRTFCKYLIMYTSVKENILWYLFGEFHLLGRMCLKNVKGMGGSHCSTIGTPTCIDIQANVYCDIFECRILSAPYCKFLFFTLNRTRSNYRQRS